MKGFDCLYEKVISLHSQKTNSVLTGIGTDRLSLNISVLCLWRVELTVIVLGALLTYVTFDFYLYT